MVAGSGGPGHPQPGLALFHRVRVVSSLHDPIEIVLVEGTSCRDIVVLEAVLSGVGRGRGHLEGVCGRPLLPLKRHSEPIRACPSAALVRVILCRGVRGQCRRLLGCKAVVQRGQHRLVELRGCPVPRQVFCSLSV